jgi:hypothetical protein
LEAVRKIYEHNTTAFSGATNGVQADCGNHIDAPALVEVAVSHEFKEVVALLKVSLAGDVELSCKSIDVLPACMESES